MLKKVGVLPCVAVVLVIGPACLFGAVFEPWASKTQPEDVARSYVQGITNAPCTYDITMGGTIDGRMCTTLPGVYEPFEQTWESSRSIRMENIGPQAVLNPWLVLGPIDFFSQQTIASSVVAGLATDHEKALAVYYFYITHRYHKATSDNGPLCDTVQAFNVFGFNTCGNSTLCLSDLLGKVGMNDFIFSHSRAIAFRRPFSTAATTRWTGTWRPSCCCATTIRWPTNATWCGTTT